MIKLVKRSVFFKNTILYIFTSLITAGFSFLLLTILSNYLSDADFGIIENFTALSNLFIHILCWGNEANIVHYYSEKTKKEEYYQVFNCILIQSIIVLFVVVLFNLNILYISRTVLICSVIYAILNSFYTVVMASLQLEKKVTKFSIATISCSVLNFGLSIVFVLKTGNYWGRIGGLFISMFLVFLIVLFSSMKSKLENFSIKIIYIKNAYLIGFPLFIGQICSWLLEKVDRFIISDILSINDTGVYGVGYQFGMVLMVIETAISRAWMPYVLENIKANKKNLIRKSANKLSVLLIGMTAVISLISFFYIKFFINNIFSQAQFIAPFIALSYCFDGIWKLYNNILVLEKKYYFTTFLIIISSVSNIILNVFIIRTFGLIGAAYSKAISFGIGMVIAIVYVKYIMRWFNEKI